jgi:hypothetical protein
MTRLDAIVIAALFVFITLAVWGKYVPEQGRRPLPPHARVVPVPSPSAPAAPAPMPPPVTPERVRRPPLLPPRAPTDPLFETPIDVLKSGTVTLGTAFPVNPNGTWLTARHVANETCGQLILVVGGRQMAASIAFQHPDADLAIVTTARGAPAILVSDDALLIGDTGRSFGYPAGMLGASEDTLMGRTRMKLGGRIAGIGATLTWAEGRRFPDTLERLGGISGGPMFDESGRVVGIAVAASVRRGRVETVAPEMIAEARQATGLFALGIAETGMSEIAGTDDGLAGAAAALERGWRIAKLYCKAR